MGIYIGLGFLALIILFFVSSYNGFVKLRQRIREAFSTMDVYLKQRYDLIPNLVETVKGYASHEKETFERVVQARNRAVQAQNINEVREITAEGMMTAGEKEFNTYTAEDLNIDPKTIGLEGSPTRVISTYEQTFEREKNIFEGISKEIIEKVKERILSQDVL